MPITAIALSISLLSLAGVPPLVGFWSKLVVFGAAINSGSIVAWAPYLAIAGLLNSALSLGYYAWIIKKMYMEQGPDMTKVKEPRAIAAGTNIRHYIHGRFRDLVCTCFRVRVKGGPSFWEYRFRDFQWLFVNVTSS